MKTMIEAIEASQEMIESVKFEDLKHKEELLKIAGDEELAEITLLFFKHGYSAALRDMKKVVENKSD